MAIATIDNNPLLGCCSGFVYMYYFSLRWFFFFFFFFLGRGGAAVG